ncbi:MAG: hypothetical protein CL881_03810 [Dehalococcoidia bacterium]|nr:hypothetical protein [Dehalococcoidia bacterium]|tara:strand:- start:296 stop:598 length:303 start_codon:yes stop_codon:yes gene_type:complete
MSATVPKRKRKASTNAIREIKREQGKTNLVIPSAPFVRLVQEEVSAYHPNMRIKTEAYEALQQAAEGHLIELFRRSNRCAIHEKRETIQPKDVQLALSLE